MNPPPFYKVPPPALVPSASNRFAGTAATLPLLTLVQAAVNQAARQEIANRSTRASLSSTALTYRADILDSYRLLSQLLRQLDWRHSSVA